MSWSANFEEKTTLIPLLAVFLVNVAITQYQKNYRFSSDNSAKLVIFKSIFFNEILIISKKENYFDVNKTFVFRYFIFVKFIIKIPTGNNNLIQSEQPSVKFYRIPAAICNDEIIEKSM